MKVLLDTHILLWSLTNASKLSQDHRDIIADPTNSVSASAVTIAEIAIKRSLGKLKVPPSLERNYYAELLRAIEESGIEMIDFTTEHATRLGSLPFYHWDPFDRMIISQALSDSYAIITVDGAFTAYPVTIV